VIAALATIQMIMAPVVPPETRTLPAISWTCTLDGYRAGKNQISGDFGSLNAFAQHPIKDAHVPVTHLEDQTGLLTSELQEADVVMGDYLATLSWGKSAKEITWHFDPSGAGLITIRFFAVDGSPQTKVGNCTTKQLVAERG